MRPGGRTCSAAALAVGGGSGPEFLSATLLPGRGINVLQITAYLPEKGEVNLLVHPHWGGDPANERDRRGRAGGESLEMGGAIEAPWAGRISGQPPPDGGTDRSMAGTSFSPANGDEGQLWMGGAMATGGLLLKRAATT